MVASKAGADVLLPSEGIAPGSTSPLPPETAEGTVANGVAFPVALALVAPAAGATPVVVAEVPGKQDEVEKQLEDGAVILIQTQDSDRHEDEEQLFSKSSSKRSFPGLEKMASEEVVVDEKCSSKGQ